MNLFRKFLKIDEPELFASIGKASVIGMHMVSGVLVGGAIGYGLDKWLDTWPLLFIIFLAFGVGAGFRNVYLDTKLLMRAQEKQDAERTDKKD